MLHGKARSPSCEMKAAPAPARCSYRSGISEVAVVAQKQISDCGSLYLTTNQPIAGKLVSEIQMETVLFNDNQHSPSKARSKSGSKGLAVSGC